MERAVGPYDLFWPMTWGTPGFAGFAPGWDGDGPLARQNHGKFRARTVLPSAYPASLVIIFCTFGTSFTAPLRNSSVCLRRGRYLPIGRLLSRRHYAAKSRQPFVGKSTDREGAKAGKRVWTPALPGKAFRVPGFRFGSAGFKVGRGQFEAESAKSRPVGIPSSRFQVRRSGEGQGDGSRRRTQSRFQVIAASSRVAFHLMSITILYIITYNILLWRMRDITILPDRVCAHQTVHENLRLAVTRVRAGPY
jgi:hypothetical protein